MDDIAVCIVTHNDFFTTKLAIDRLIDKTNLKPRLYIIDNGSTDIEFMKYLKDICSQNGWYLKGLKDKSYSEALNEAVRIVYQKYCVVFPVNAFVQNNWLEDLIHYQKLVPNAGISSIRSGKEHLHFMPLIHKCDSMPEDELKNVLISDTNSVEGILCFDRSKCDQIGFFDEKLLHRGFEQHEFCFRIASMGLNNFYIRKQTCLKIPISNEVLFPAKTGMGMLEFKQQVDWMIKNQMFKK